MSTSPPAVPLVKPFSRPPIRLGIIATHPVQYHSHWYRALAAQPDLAVEVLYCHSATASEQAEAGFGVEFEWDLPLLEGYRNRFLNNTAKKPSTRTFRGLDTPDLRQLVSGYDAVVVTGWHYKSAWQAIYGCWRSGTPVLVRGDSHLYTKRSPIKLLLKRAIYRAVISRFDACLAVGKWSREYFQHYGAPPGRVFHVPHSVDSDLFAHDPENSDSLRNAWRFRLGVSEDRCVFLFSGKFISKKRPLDFVNGVLLAHRRGAKVTGVMVGDGMLRPVCQQMAESTGAPILFTGFLNQTEIRAAYAGCDVLVLPSDGGETWGLVINEAMASGRPCIVTDQVGAGPDLIEPGVTGDIFAMGNVSELAALMGKYAANLNAAREMESAVKQKLARYSVQAAVDGTREALHRALRSRKRAERFPDESLL